MQKWDDKSANELNPETVASDIEIEYETSLRPGGKNKPGHHSRQNWAIFCKQAKRSHTWQKKTKIPMFILKAK